ncbi:glycosyltransferase family 39 protein [Roseovarius sp. M141]|uniref:glycosyltransferase family 39 protein n=1 Tax=Roseovarius sp. M141 TaxID=2583806 RepID=UPI0020CD52D3|nr:glycosyltransferase family 39 protein [Roseovarius sp. M141]
MRLDLFSTVVFSAITALFMMVVLLNAAFGVFYDTDHFADTQFLLGAAWRVHQGLIPAVDFGHFYGGIMAQGISGTMSLFGHSVFVFDYFTILATLFLSACAFLILRPQISWAGFAVIVVMLSTLLLTRFPLENETSITQVVSTHSFLYNRFALAIFLILGLFVALPAPILIRDMWGAILAGALAGLVCLTKPTFVILPVGLLLAVLVQGRWLAMVGVLSGAALVFACFDPTLGRMLGSFDYALAHVGSDNDLGGLIRKTVQVPLAQPIAVSLAFGGLIYLLYVRGFGRFVIAILGFSAAGAGLTATMGGNGNLGQLAIPIAVMISLGVSEITRHAVLPRSETFQFVTVCLVLAFVVPHLLNLIGTTAEGISRRGAMQITQGPFMGYLSYPDRAPEDVTQYDTLVDGIAALQQLGDPTKWGIVANNGVTFEYALMARPVPGYPLWERASAPEFDADRPFAPAADIVMLRHSDQPIPLEGMLREKIAEDFVICATSLHWEIYRRLTREITACDAP